MNYRIHVKVESKDYYMQSYSSVTVFYIQFPPRKKLMVVQKRCIYTISYNSKQNVKRVVEKVYSRYYECIYTGDIVSLPGGIKEFHEGNGICTRIFYRKKERKGYFRAEVTAKVQK